MSRTGRLILASASPRRRELLAYLGIEFRVVPADVDETVPGAVDRPAEFAGQLARSKALDVSRQHPEAAVLAADTIVVMDEKILGKPADEHDACRTLHALRGRAHQVTTAVALASGPDLLNEHVTTDVVMRYYTEQEIASYIASGDPFDKAGSYGIQDRQFRPVQRCDGCYCNVVGLPILAVQRILQQAGLSVADAHELELPAECGFCPLADRREVARG